MRSWYSLSPSNPFVCPYRDTQMDQRKSCIPSDIIYSKYRACTILTAGLFVSLPFHIKHTIHTHEPRVPKVWSVNSPSAWQALIAKPLDKPRHAKTLEIAHCLPNGDGRVGHKHALIQLHTFQPILQALADKEGWNSQRGIPGSYVHVCERVSTIHPTAPRMSPENTGFVMEVRRYTSVHGFLYN